MFHSSFSYSVTKYSIFFLFVYLAVCLKTLCLQHVTRTRFKKPLCLIHYNNTVIFCQVITDNFKRFLYDSMYLFLFLYTYYIFSLSFRFVLGISNCVYGVKLNSELKHFIICFSTEVWESNCDGYVTVTLHGSSPYNMEQWQSVCVFGVWPFRWLGPISRILRISLRV
jgi:hypothetical protein